MSTYQEPTLWVQTPVGLVITPKLHPVVIPQILKTIDNVCVSVTIKQAWCPLFQMSTLLFTYMEATGSFSGTVLGSPLPQCK